MYGCSQLDPEESILQPVLGWNDPIATLGAVWSIASWNCCLSGTTQHSEFVPVNVGDTIAGSIQSTCGAGTLSCPAWNITTTDETTGGSIVLSNTPSEGQTFNWAFAGVLEVYDVSQCSDYPPNSGTIFSNLYLQDNTFTPIANPGWTFDNQSAGLTPQCSYGGQAYGAQVELNYGSTPPALPPTYIEQSSTPSPSNCYESMFGYPPCYMTDTATVSVAPEETLYINGAAVNGANYNYSQSEYWGSGQCGYIYDQGYQCWGYATPNAPAYATEPGYSDSITITVR